MKSDFATLQQVLSHHHHLPMHHHAHHHPQLQQQHQPQQHQEQQQQLQQEQQQQQHLDSYHGDRFQYDRLNETDVNADNRSYFCFFAPNQGHKQMEAPNGGLGLAASHWRSARRDVEALTGRGAVFFGRHWLPAPYSVTGSQ